MPKEKMKSNVEATIRSQKVSEKDSANKIKRKPEFHVRARRGNLMGNLGALHEFHMEYIFIMSLLYYPTIPTACGL